MKNERLFMLLEFEAVEKEKQKMDEIPKNDILFDLSKGVNITAGRYLMEKSESR